MCPISIFLPLVVQLNEHGLAANPENISDNSSNFKSNDYQPIINH